ncbi:MAG: peptidoglycan DD-metalloendopeptidase family protein [Desulfobacterales bacterium]
MGWFIRTVSRYLPHHAGRRTEKTCGGRAGFLFSLTGCLCLVLMSADLRAKEKSIGELKKEAARVKTQMTESKNRLEEASRKEKDQIGELDEADKALSEAQKKETGTRMKLAEVEKKLAAAQAAHEELNRQIKTGETYAAQRAVGLYKLNCLGRMHVLAGADSLTDFFQRKKAMETVLRHDENVLADLKRHKAMSREVTENLNARKAEYMHLEAQHRKQVGLLALQKEKRQHLLTEIRKEKSLAKASLLALKQAAEELDKKVKSLQALESVRKKKDSPAPFPVYRGSLNMPVKGKIVSFFGPYKNTEFNVMNFQSGIDIQTGMGEPIRSVEEGEVVFAEWFKGYGNMIIIDHGDHFFTLYAHAQEMFKAKGDSVKKGEMIGTVGDSGSMNGPGLHFEVRHHGKPVDPLKWLK